MNGRLFRHKKRGSIYLLVNCGELAAPAAAHEGDRIPVIRCGESVPYDFAELQASAAVEIGDIVTVYRCLSTGKLWARPTSEFFDGRFEEIANIEAAP